MTRDVLTILAVKIECERIFSIAENCYDHRKRYNSKTFLTFMLIRFFEQKKNVQEKLNVNFEINEQFIHEKLIREMKRRDLNMKEAYNTQYINDDEKLNNMKLNDSFSFLHNIRTINYFLFVFLKC
jgi:hypothetical protein